MPRSRLKQLAQDGAVDGQAIRWNNTAGQWEPSAVGLFDAIVASSGGDYASIQAAFAAGEVTVAVAPGTYNETADINIPDSGQLIGFGEVVIDFGANSAGLTADAGGTTQTAGTVAVTADSTAVVGTGTSWVTNGLAAGDWIAIVGVWFEISSVTDDTNLVLVKQWENTTQSGLEYVARPGRRDIRIENVTVQNIGTVSNTGLYIRGGIDAHIIDVTIRRPVNNVGLMTGVQLISGSYYMRGCHIRDQSSEGIVLNTVRGCTIVDTVVDNGVTSADCIKMLDARYVTITGGRLQGGGAAVNMFGTGNDRNRIDTLMLDNNIGLDIGGNENIVSGVMRSFNTLGNNVSVSGDNNVILLDHTGTKTDTGTGNKFGVDALGIPAQGDVLYHDGTDWVRLAPGTSGNVLQTQGAGANPLWAAPGSGTDGAAIHDNVAGEIALIAEKVVPVPADLIIIEDSAAANAKKRVQVGNLDDDEAIHDDVNGEISAIAEKVAPVAGDWLLIEDSAASDAKKCVQIGNLPGGGGGVFGTEYHTGESNALSTTTSTSFIQKLKLTTATVPAGDYYIGWSCELYSSNKEVELQVQLDDSEVLQLGVSKIKGSFHEIHAGFAIRTLTNATHDIDIDFRDTGSGPSTANIEKARLVFWRVT